MKRMGREPFCGNAVIAELYRRGDLTRADTIKVPGVEATATAPTPSSGVLSSLRSSLGRYLWTTPRAATAPGAEDAVVPTAALSRAAEAAKELVGSIATAEIHTIHSFAERLTGGNERDAEAVAAHLESIGRATVLFTEATEENPVPVAGVRLGAGPPTQADRGLLQTKAVHERIERAAQQYEAEAEKAKQEAVAAAKGGDKKGAIEFIQRKSKMEKKLANNRATLRKLGDVLMAVDETESNREAVAALETGMNALRKATAAGGVNAERVDNVATDLDELLAEQEDMRIAIGQIQVDNEAESAMMEAELDRLMEEDHMSELSRPDLEVPTTKPGAAVAPGEQARAEELAEMELAELLGEKVVEERNDDDGLARGRVAAP